MRALTEGSRLTIETVRRTEDEILISMESGVPPPDEGKIVELQGVHESVDGPGIVTKRLLNGFIVAAPSGTQRAPGQAMSLIHSHIKGSYQVCCTQGTWIRRMARQGMFMRLTIDARCTISL